MVYECGVASQLLISNITSTPRGYWVDGIFHTLNSYDKLLLPCFGSIDIAGTSGIVQVQQIASPLSTLFGSLELVNQVITVESVYFFLGVVVAIAFIAGLRTRT